PNGSKIERRFGKALGIVKPGEASLRVFLCGHMDTVLKPVPRPEKAIRPGDGRMWGTGASDAKGGLVVMLAALECFERSPFAGRLGWEGLIVPDEEIGSLGSRPLLEEAAGRCNLGLLFEPAQSDGALVGDRVGSGNFSATVRGRAAHAGRHIEAGRNAIEALADFIVALRDLREIGDQIRINVGAVEGGGPVNVVPDLAGCRFNIRVRDMEAMGSIRQGIDRIAARIGRQREVSVEITGGFGRPPKPLNPEILYLLEQFASCGKALDLAIHWRSSGGVCDGNTLLAAGLPNVDSLGPVGDGLHTGDEFVTEASITERARLTALFLMRLAAGDIPWPPKGIGV
ncbi:MAG: hydrolase, partial [Pseudomonadota bacterium]